jgi:hypothetical protein
LWADAATFTTNTACAKDVPLQKNSSACAEFLQTNEKAREEWKLEQRFAEFEGKR